VQAQVSPLEFIIIIIIIIIIRIIKFFNVA